MVIFPPFLTAILPFGRAWMRLPIKRDPPFLTSSSQLAGIIAGRLIFTFEPLVILRPKNLKKPETDELKAFMYLFIALHLSGNSAFDLF